MHSKVLSLLTLAGAAQAHMSMFYPPPLGGAPSINKQSTSIDKQFNYPLGCCGGSGGATKKSPGICRGHLDKFDTEEASVTWEPGQDAYFQLTDYSYDPNAPGSTHSGGSCQVGFSVDKGKTWKVAASYHGACPKHTEDGSPEAQTFDFKVPTGMPEGDVLFMWNWLNREHEAFSNCAKVRIASSSSKPSPPSQSPGTSAKPPANSPVASSKPPQQSPTTPQKSDGVAPPAFTSAPRPSSTSRPQRQPSSSAAGSPPARPTQSPSDNTGDSTDNFWWPHPPHKEVNPNARKYTVDGWSCECRRETSNSRCYCVSDDPTAEKRSAVEKKALRMHRRTLYKRTDACDWATAPAMEVSYYTPDAKCAPNAKLNVPTSDAFELSWDVKCGVVEGDGTYPIKQFSCDMYG